jgi:hypothetical protein
VRAVLAAVAGKFLELAVLATKAGILLLRVLLVQRRSLIVIPVTAAAAQAQLAHRHLHQILLATAGQARPRPIPACL